MENDEIVFKEVDEKNETATEKLEEGIEKLKTVQRLFCSTQWYQLFRGQVVTVVLTLNKYLLTV